MSEYAQALMAAMGRRRDSKAHPDMMEAHENMDKGSPTPETIETLRMQSEHDGETAPEGARQVMPHNEMQTTASQMGLMHDAMNHQAYAKSGLTGRAMAEAEEKQKQKK